MINGQDCLNIFMIETNMIHLFIIHPLVCLKSIELQKLPLRAPPSTKKCKLQQWASFLSEMQQIF